MTQHSIALVVSTHHDERVVVAEVNESTTVRELAVALGAPAAQLFTLDGPLDADATLVETKFVSGQLVGIDRQVHVEWKQLGPELRVIGGIGSGLRQRIEGGVHVLGRDGDIALAGDRMSRRHAEIEWLGDEFRVRDLGSKHGTFVEGDRLAAHEWMICASGAAVLLADTVVTMTGSTGASSIRRHGGPFHSAHVPGRPDAPLAAPSHRLPSAPTTTERRSLAPLVIPSAGAVALAAAAGGAPTGVALAATPAAVVVGLLADKGLSARTARRARTRQAARVAAARDEVVRAAATRGLSERAAHPDPASLLATAERRSPKLWSTGLDQLMVRVGLQTVADGVAIEAPDTERDALADAAAVHLVPTTVALSDGPFVVAGPEPHLDDLTTWIAMQAVALVAPAQLDVVVISIAPAEWAWLSLTPHGATPTVLPADTEPSDLPERRASQRLVILDRPTAAAWFDDRARRDDLVLWRTDDAGEVPALAATVATSSGDATVRVEAVDGTRRDVLADRLFDRTQASRALGVALAGLRSVASMPADRPVDIAELCEQVTSVDALVRAWQTTPVALRFVIGANADGPTTIELAGQNSHMLVAGTTGSGKTRLLETLAVGLAAAFPPDAVQFLIIDFKGGNELAALGRLPHCGGIVSDRDPTNVDRAIAALTREIARRDALFATVEATDLDDYVRKSGARVARLVVIADEFGQFRRDDAMGDRVGALLRVAAQGRSKGVHLVLATQSPSTDVTADIRQNVGVRVCLRVAETAESVAVLGAPDAAALRSPGDVLVAVDGHIRQSRVALSRGPHALGTPPVLVRDLVTHASTSRPTLDSATDLLDEIIDTVIAATAAIGVETEPLLAPALPESLLRRDVRGATRTWTAGGFVLGERDRPGVPDAAPFTFDPVRDGVLTIVGGPRSGRTSTLLAVAEAARDQRDPHHPVVVHTIDWGGDLTALRGADLDAGYVARGDVDHLRRTVYALERGTAAATRVLLIDRFDSLVRDTRELDGGAFVVALTEMIASGRSRGVFTALTVDATALVANATSFGGARLVLPIADASMRVAAGIPATTTAAPGRGIATADGDQVQVGLSAPPASSAGLAPGVVAPMPTDVAVARLGFAEGERFLLGVGGQGALEPLAIDIDTAGPIIAVIGRRGSGRSNALEAIAATYAGSRHVVRVGGEAIQWDRTQPPALLLVDDTVRAAQHNPFLAAPTLDDDLRAGHHVMVAVFDQAELTGLGFNHWLTRRPCSGLLLALDATADRIVAGERVGFHPPAELRAGPVGRGWWSHRGSGTPVQVARI